MRDVKSRSRVSDHSRPARGARGCIYRVKVRFEATRELLPFLIQQLNIIDTTTFTRRVRSHIYLSHFFRRVRGRGGEDARGARRGAACRGGVGGVMDNTWSMGPAPPELFPECSTLISAPATSGRDTVVLSGGA